MDQDASWYGDRPRPTRHCVRWESSYLSPKGAHPQFGANVRCGQTAGWMKAPLDTEVDLGLGHVTVLDGFTALCERGTAAPSFRPMSVEATIAHLIYC